MCIYNSRKEDELREINVYRKEKKSPFLSLREKFSQAFGQAGMWWGGIASFLHSTHAEAQTQEQMALWPSLRNLTHRLPWQCIELLEVDRDPEHPRDMALSE